MKQRPLSSGCSDSPQRGRTRASFALAAALCLLTTTPALAAHASKDDQIKALHALIDAQQQQLDRQQHALDMLRSRLQHVEGEQATQQRQLQARATTPAPKPAASAVTSAPGLTVDLHGFINATAFTQDKSFIFGNGQNAEFPKSGSHGRMSGVDVRNTRFWLDFKGARFSDAWRGGGRLELDFFGGFNGSGPYSQQQPIPRLRQAYMDLVNAGSGTTVKIGQQWELMFPIDNVPASLTHVGFPLGFATGMIGWRFPGVVVMQDLGHGSDGPQWRLDLGAFEGSWDGPGNNVDFLTAGNANFHPQLQARLHVKGQDWLAYLAGTWSKVDLKGVGGSAPTPIKNTITSEGVEIGGQWHPGHWMFKANAYTGSGLGQIFGGLVQFGDIGETGGYLQAGYHFTPHWSANAFYGYSRADRSDVVAWLGNGAAGRLKNRQAALNLEYGVGPYAFGVEWLHDTLDATSDGTNTTSTSGNQFSVSAMYHF